jgi:hypothetical protein
VSLVLGVRVSRRNLAGERSFSWARAVTAGGFAGILASLIFNRWMYVGDFFPLVAGLELHARSMSVVLQFLMALLIGSTFGLLFQHDVRSFGSSMGWGLGYGIFWWFLGQLTILPLLGGSRLDWSAIAQASCSARWWAIFSMGLFLESSMRPLTGCGCG